MISWIHFGDLHMSGREDRNHRDFLFLIEEANRCMRSGIAFALLPGDNADDAEEDEYQLVQAAVSRCRFPVQAIPGDHDIVTGDLNLFRRYLSDTVYRTLAVDDQRFIFLNSVAEWHPPVFGLGAEQMSWLRNQLSEQAVVFMHAYPSEHGQDARELRELFRNNRVLLVEMGHTHYNEIANDGATIYVTTRSNGQIEEGPPGFSVTTIDNGVVSWNFKPIGRLPLVQITSPADRRLIIDPSSPAQVVRGAVQVRARVWGDGVREVTMSLDDGELRSMDLLDECTWTAVWDSPQIADGQHSVTVRAATCDGQTGADRIEVLVSRHGAYQPPPRFPVDYENAVGAWPDKSILGTQLGPNENGRHWPSRHERERVAK